MSLVRFKTEWYRASVYRGYMGCDTITCYLKQDALGFILDPVDMSFKAGWGATLVEAKVHFMARNPKVISELH